MGNKLEIQRLKDLLKARKEDYAMFGVTTEDIRKDGEIIEKITELSND